MDNIAKVAVMADKSNNALMECAALCQKTIFSCNKQAIKPASYYLAIEIQKVAESQIADNKVLLKSILRGN